MGLVNLVPGNTQYNNPSRTTHCVPNSKGLVFFELLLIASSLCDMSALPSVAGARTFFFATDGRTGGWGRTFFFLPEKQVI